MLRFDSCHALVRESDQKILGPQRIYRDWMHVDPLPSSLRFGRARLATAFKPIGVLAVRLLGPAAL
jgi:hypothetical protein